MKVYAFGQNYHGQLGTFPNANSGLDLTLIPQRFAQISSEECHTLALDNNGNVWSAGNNRYGQLGLGDEYKYYINCGGKYRDAFTQIPSSHFDDRKIVQVEAGRDQSFCLDDQGQVWSFGRNYFGSLGFDQELYPHKKHSLGYPYLDLPKLIPPKYFQVDNQQRKIISVSAGYDHTLVLDDQNQVWSFGWNLCGQLGIENLKESVKPIRLNLENVIQISAGCYFSLCLDKFGKVWSFGFKNKLGCGELTSDQFTPKIISSLKNILQISAGLDHSLALDKENKIWGFGYNENEQLMHQKNREPKLLLNPIRVYPEIFESKKILQVAAGKFGNLVLDDENQLWGFGSNLDNQLGFDQKGDFFPMKLFEDLKVDRIFMGGSTFILVQD